MKDAERRMQKSSSWIEESVYEKINRDITNEWPQWKKEAYNEMFAVSTHASKLSISK